MNFTVIQAIFKRDFISYFSNPTGYVFICVFVVMSAMATFTPPEFFNYNLANLDQLSARMPLILLVFVPAITMSTWSEERRQGTDELLLTIPASDIDVVLGKYLASAVIYTVSLIFSMLSIWVVFIGGLGSPDPGLFMCTYLGYWFLGLAMLSIGMVASFLTKNLTVGFVLGVLFNAPLAILNNAESQWVSRWSASSQLADFERGVISLSGVTYFISLVIVMLYICMVLIGKRHWGTGDDGDSSWAHYLGRALSLIVIFGCLNVVISNYNSLRADVSSEKINSLSTKTIEQLDELSENEKIETILVDAFVSPNVPREYAAHKLNLLGTLQELQSRSGGKIHVNVYQIEKYDEEASTAENAFNIVPQTVNTMSRGVMTPEDIFMGVAVRHKLDKVVVPFIDKGIPVEYELMRSILTVAEDKRSRVGVVKTDAELFGGFSMQGPTEERELVRELRKQYDVVEVDPEQPITGDYDVLLVVQPSAMSPPAMDNLVAAVRQGKEDGEPLPIAIFEDAMPVFWGVPGTDTPRTTGGGPMAMFGGGQQMPKGDVQQLFRMLGIEFETQNVVLQKYNPYPQYPFPDFFVFIDEGLTAYGTSQPFNEDEMMTAGFRQILTAAPSAMTNDADSKLEATPLLVTGNLTATVPYQVVTRMTNNALDMLLERTNSKDSRILGYKIEGELENIDDLEGDLTDRSDEEEGEDAESSSPRNVKIKAVVISDIDCLYDEFFRIRSQGEQTFSNFPDLKFQNVSFVLNVLDYLAGDERFLELRKRTRPHRVLTKIEEATYDAREKSREALDEARNKVEEAKKDAQNKFEGKIEAIRNTDLSEQEKMVLIERTQITESRKLERQIAQLDKEFQRTSDKTQRTLERTVEEVQDRYKVFAILLPPILPILIGILVFFHRRSGERQGVAKTRLRFNQSGEYGS